MLDLLTKHTTSVDFIIGIKNGNGLEHCLDKTSGYKTCSGFWPFKSCSEYTEYLYNSHSNTFVFAIFHVLLIFNFFLGCHSSTVVLSRSSSRCVTLNRLLVMAALGLAVVIRSVGNGLVLLRDLSTMVAKLRDQLLEVSLFLLI